MNCAGLKFYMLWHNAPNISFGSNEMSHLDYLINQEGNKPNLIKVQKISYIESPDFMNETQEIISMLQYYNTHDLDIYIQKKTLRLRRLDRKNTWKNEQEVTLDKLKPVFSDETF